jgi:hypothetical protein
MEPVRGEGTGRWYQPALMADERLLEQWFAKVLGTPPRAGDSTAQLAAIRHGCLLAAEGQSCQRQPDELKHRDACLSTVRAVRPAARSLVKLLAEPTRKEGEMSIWTMVRELSLSQQRRMQTRIVRELAQVEHVLTLGAPAEVSQPTG